jgi:hypothetical protein
MSLANLSFRPKNLPPKNKEEERRHRRLVDNNRKLYIRKIKRKERELKMRQIKEENRENRLSELKIIWETEILPFWNEEKGSRRVIALWKEGLPPAVRGKIWMLSIGNQSFITNDLFKICSHKALYTFPSPNPPKTNN